LKNCNPSTKSNQAQTPMSKLLRITLVIAFLFLCHFTKAGTFYISPAGNDATGNGSAGNPWRTLYKACATVNTPGDIIFVNAGTYVETQQCLLAAGVNLDGVGETAVIQSTLTAVFTPILILGSPFMGANGNQYVRNLKFDGRLTTQMAIIVSGRSNVDIYNCRFYDFVDAGVTFRGRTDFQDGPPSIYSTGNKFHHNYMYNCSKSDVVYGRGNLQVGGQEGILIYNDTIIQPARAGNLSGYCIKNSNQGFLRGMKIYNCYLEVPPYPYAVVNTNNHWSFALEFSDQWGSEIYNNRILGSADQNHQNVDATYPFSVWYHHNEFGFDNLQANPIEGVILEYNTVNAIIEDNIFKNTAVPLYFTPRANNVMNGVVFRKNYCYNVGMSTPGNYAQCIKINGSQPPFSCYGWKIINNTIIANTTMPPQYGIDVPVGDSMVVRNNIVRGFVYDMHLLGNATNSKFWRVTENNYATAQNLGTPAQSVLSPNINQAPNINAATGIPNAGSPMIDAGKYIGLSYFGLAPDIGYGEFPTAGNISPTAIVPANRRLIQPLNSLVLNGAGYDPDGTVVSYQWTQQSGPTTATFSNATNAVTTASNLLNTGAYVFRLTVTDNNGATAFSNVTITVTSAGSNALPVVNATPPTQTITSPTSQVAINVSATDADGSIVSYLATKLSGSGTITNPTAMSTTVTSLSIGSTVIEMTAIDNDGGIGRDTVLIIVQPPPSTTLVSVAGPDQTINTNNTILQGYGIPPATGGYNLFLQSQALNTTPWNGNVVTVTANAAPDLLGNVTMEQLNMLNAGVSYWGQGVNVLPNTTYYYSFDVRRGTATDLAWGVRDQSNFIDLVPPSSFYALTTPNGTTRVTLSFTTGPNTTNVTIHPLYKTNATGTVFIGRCQLALSSSQLYNVTTTTAFTGGNVTGNIAAYQWTKLTGGNAIIATPTNDTTIVTGLTVGVYTFELAVTDNQNSVAKDTVQVTVTSTNTPPTANAGADQTITLPTSNGTLTGSGADPDGTITTYAWTKVSGPAGEAITTPAAATTTITGLAQGTYVFRLTVTDNEGATGSDEVTITVVAPPNAPPTANAGLDQSITLPVNTVTLNGSGTDTDGTITTYAWTKISGSAAGTITTPTSATTTVTGLTQGVYQFELRVTDNGGAIDTDTVQVTVNPDPNVPPTASAGPDQTLLLPTNNTILNGTGTDTDGTIASYAWTKIAGPAAGVIGTPTSATTTITGLTQGVYQFELTVTDNNGATGKDTVQITVVNPLNVPPTVNAGLDQVITLPLSTVTLTGTANDTDGTITSYNWTKISGPTGGTITSPTVITTIVTGLTQGIYIFRLTVIDSDGATASDDISITVNPAPNVAPTANAGVDQTITLPTNTTTLAGSGTDPDGTISTYAWTKVSGPAGGNISSPGAATTGITALTQGIYIYRLTITDNSGATATDEITITVNPAPNVAPTANAGTDQIITLPTNATVLSGSGTDPDGTITTYAWAKVSGPVGGAITTPSSATTAITGLTQGVYIYRLTVTDNSGATATDNVTITVNLAPNILPTANAGIDQTITLPTNATTLTGSGTDPDGTITAYAWTKISGPAGGNIASPATATSAITALQQGVYIYRLTVTDNRGGTATDDVTITVNNTPNVAPTANAGIDQTITLPTSATTLTGSGTDPDGTITAYAWVKVSGPAGGVIASPAAATSAITALQQGVYIYRLTVTDNSGATATDEVTITVVLAPNILPTANAGLDQVINLPANTATLTGSGNDADGTIATYAWTKVSGPASGTITSPAAPTTTLTGLTQGIYVFRLTVTDNRGGMASDDVRITVNAAPVANAGADIFITLPVNNVTLNGSATDADGTIAAYSWVKIAGPAAGTIVSPATASSSVTGLIQGIFRYELTVTDNNGATDKDTVQVVVFATNVAPTANAGLNQTITLPTNSVTLTGSGSDVDGTITTYRWNKMSGPTGGFITNAAAAATTVTGLTAGVYVFELTVTDNSGATAKATVQVTVNAANIPPVANAGLDQTVILPINTTVLNGSGTDADGTVVSYLWKQIAGPADKLTSVNTASTTLQNLVEGTYGFELTVTDNRGAIDKDTIVVIVENPGVADKNTVMVYPNPVIDNATLDIRSTVVNAVLLIVVTDMQGKQVYSKQLNATLSHIKEPLNLSNLAKGPYLVTVYFGGTVKESFKILKK
jgi:hypothetical protein